MGRIGYLMLALHPRSTPRRRGTPNSTLSELIGLGRPAQNGLVKPYVQLLDRIYIDVPPSHIKPQESGSDREAFFSEIYRDFMVDFGYTT